MVGHYHETASPQMGTLKVKLPNGKVTVYTVVWPDFFETLDLSKFPLSFEPNDNDLTLIVEGFFLFRDKTFAVPAEDLNPNDLQLHCRLAWNLGRAYGQVYRCDPSTFKPKPTEEHLLHYFVSRYLWCTENDPPELSVFLNVITFAFLQERSKTDSRFKAFREGFNFAFPA